MIILIFDYFADVCQCNNVYLNVPRPLDVLAVVSPVSGAAEPLSSELPLEYPRHLDAVLGLEHMAAVCDEVLHYT